MKNKVVNNLIALGTIVLFLALVAAAVDAADHGDNDKALWVTLISYLLGLVAGLMVRKSWSSKKKK